MSHIDETCAANLLRVFGTNNNTWKVSWGCFGHNNKNVLLITWTLRHYCVNNRMCGTEEAHE